MIGRIYKIISEADESVTCTIQALRYRLSKHKSSYKRWKNGAIKNCCMIYHEFNKYGVESFKIELIEEIQFDDRCDLYRRENHYIHYISTTKKIVLILE